MSWSCRSKRGGLLATSVSLLLGTLPAAQAYVSYFTPGGQAQKWNLTRPSVLVHTNVVNPVTRSVRYSLGANAYSTANRAAELDAARACFDQWQAVPGTILRFEEGLLVPGTPDVNTTDNTNLVYWVKDTTVVNGGLDNISGATGVAFADYFSDGTLAEVDIVLNGRVYSWFTDYNNTANRAQFIESVLLHEIGHLIGLAHSPAGGATMFPRGGGGVDAQSGLSVDEIAAVRALYPGPTTPASARLSGRVTKKGTSTPVFGALISIEDSAGNIGAAAVTQADGRYSVSALSPGSYQVRATPVDPAAASYGLFKGRDVAASYETADHQFLPTTNTAVILTAGRESTVNFTVTEGTPTFRVGRIWPPTSNPALKVVVNYPISVAAGGADLIVGVYSADVPPVDAVLRVSGDGVTTGATAIELNAFPGVNPPLNLISVPLTISANATPGLRSLSVHWKDSLAYANGFLDISPPFPDFNFDSLDDRFQRQFFSRWTSPQAAPTVDADNDHFTNAEEYMAGSDPTNAESVLILESVRYDTRGATLTWPSAPGRRYQVLGRPRIDSVRGWQPVGGPVTASGETAEFLDGSSGAPQQFYRVQALP
ncbi:MAG: carboxypeptidase regulatory-like domain-containing protein [Verrucomicrobiia bacterium]